MSSAAIIIVVVCLLVSSGVGAGLYFTQNGDCEGEVTKGTECKDGFYTDTYKITTEKGWFGKCDKKDGETSRIRSCTGSASTPCEGGFVQTNTCVEGYYQKKYIITKPGVDCQYANNFTTASDRTCGAPSGSLTTGGGASSQTSKTGGTAPASKTPVTVCKSKEFKQTDGTCLSIVGQWLPTAAKPIVRMLMLANDDSFTFSQGAVNGSGHYIMTNNTITFTVAAGLPFKSGTFINTSNGVRLKTNIGTEFRPFDTFLDG